MNVYDFKSAELSHLDEEQLRAFAQNVLRMLAALSYAVDENTDIETGKKVCAMYASLIGTLEGLPQ